MHLLADIILPKMCQIRRLKALRKERERFAGSDVPDELKARDLAAMDERIAALSKAVEV